MNVQANRLQARVLDALRWDASVEAAEIGVSVHEDVITLSGYVDTFPEGWNAARIAKRVFGANAVANEIEVRIKGEHKHGRKSPRLRRIAAAFRDAGRPTRLESHIDAWLKTHEAWVSPFANAIYAAGGSNYTLAHSPDALRLLVRAIREGFLVLDQLDVPVTPARFRVSAS